MATKKSVWVRFGVIMLLGGGIAYFQMVRSGPGEFRESGNWARTDGATVGPVTCTLRADWASNLRRGAHSRSRSRLFGSEYDTESPGRSVRYHLACDAHAPVTVEGLAFELTEASANAPEDTRMLAAEGKFSKEALEVSPEKALDVSHWLPAVLQRAGTKLVVHASAEVRAEKDAPAQRFDLAVPID